MSDQTIQSQDFKIADIFQSFYVVPHYQREYVWKSEQVEQLLADINDELSGSESGKAPEYFIGSIVVCPGIDGVLELIDGQQRMTTLFLIFCALRDRFQELGGSPPKALEAQLAASYTDAAGIDCFRYRLDLQYSDSGEILERITRAEAIPATVATRSVTNILGAYRVAQGFFREHFGEDQTRLRGYYGYLTNKVKMIRIQTEDVAKALKIFETINDRGVGLDAMDLLKNLLFMKASHQKFDQLKKIWKEMQDTIYAMREKPLRFLRYFIFSRYEADLLREDQIYSWFAKNEAVCRYGSAPIEFANELLVASKAYSLFLAGNDERGKKNRHLENLKLLGGEAARQHLILLLAGRKLPAVLFDRLAQEVENLFFVYVITREATRNFERSFARWAAELRAVKNSDDLKLFIEKNFEPAKAVLAERFDDAFRRLNAASVQQYRLRYILAKLTQYVDLQAYGETEGTRWLGRYASSGFEVEHILPQSPSAEADREFGSKSGPGVANQIGNLLLVEKSINASLGNRAYSKKRKVYGQSQLLMTRALTERPKVGEKTRIDAAVATIEPFESWSEEAIVKRQEMMRGLARVIWDVPAKTGAAL